MRAPTEQVISISRLICTGCGAETNATCNCGMEYRPKAALAREAIEANPEKSNRQIAEETGADPKEVRRQRAKLGEDMSPPERQGRDGKTHKVPAKKIKPDQSNAIQEVGELLVAAVDAMGTADKPKPAANAKARREKREDKIGQDNHRNILLMNSAASIQSADYHGQLTTRSSPPADAQQRRGMIWRISWRIREPPLHILPPTMA
jgi:hypothetical protein